MSFDWGTGYNDPGPVAGFSLLNVLAADNTAVDFIFTDEISDLAATYDPASYVFSGGIVALAVYKMAKRVIRVVTSPMIAGTTYTVALSNSLEDMNAELITPATLGLFVGLGPEVVYTVSSLEARPDCRGQKIFLQWTNPAGAANIKIVRRTRSWPYDLTDPADVVYDGAAVTSYTDSGPTVADLTKTLEPDTYYYYLILVSASLVTPIPDVDYDITNESQAFALSLSAIDAKEWFWKHTPREYRTQDQLSEGDGGGDGFLDKWYSVMGCWLNLMHGTVKAIQLLADDDKAPFHALPAKNRALGIEAEGFSYDYSIARRALLSLVYVYKRKGTCVGCIEAARMFTLWDASCSEVIDGDPGPNPLLTWDGTSLMDRNGGATVSVANLSLVDSSKAWTVDQWKGGTVRGAFGLIAKVASNTATELVLEPATAQTTLGVTLLGATTLTVGSTAGLYPGMQVQLESNVSSTIAEIVEIETVTAPNTVTIRYGTLHAFPAGSYLQIEVSYLPAERIGLGAAVGVIVTDATASWETNEWKGYKFMWAGENVERTVVSNDATTITLDGAPGGGSPALYAIALDFTVGAAWNLRTPISGYEVAQLGITRLYDPSFTHELIGSRFDPFNRLWMGPGSPYLGAWGPTDVLIYVLSSVAVQAGKVTVAAAGAVLDLDPTLAAPAVNSLVGYYLNPNQNQEQLFQIISNDATTVTVSGPITSLTVVGQYYVILKPRDANRFRRLTQRLRGEFSDPDVDTRVLFV